MKKIFFLFLALFFFSSSFATNPCIKITHMNAHFVWKAKFASNIRTYPCTYKSQILRASKKWETFEIIWKTYWYYQIKYWNKRAWIWDKSIEQIKNLNPDNYILTEKDKKILENVDKKIRLFIKKKWPAFKYKVINWINKILPRFKHKPRIYTILRLIKENTEKINTWFKALTNTKKIKNKPETTKQLETTKDVEASESKVNYSYPKFDIEKVKKAWLDWHNNVRKQMWLHPYIYDERLDKTAKLWSETMMKNNNISHKRHIWDSYYDYWKIADWFKQNGVVCKNIHRATFSESIAYYGGYCNNQDCTDALLKWAKSAFTFYMNEKDKKWRPHYNGIVHKLFKYMWFGVAIKKIWKDKYKFYYTTHYCTEFVK